MFNLWKLREKIKENGLASAAKKTARYITYKTEKFYFDNLFNSFKVLISKDNILVILKRGKNG